MSTLAVQQETVQKAARGISWANIVPNHLTTGTNARTVSRQHDQISTYNAHARLFFSTPQYEVVITVEKSSSVQGIDQTYSSEIRATCQETTAHQSTAIPCVRCCSCHSSSRSDCLAIFCSFCSLRGMCAQEVAAVEEKGKPP